MGFFAEWIGYYIIWFFVTIVFIWIFGSMVRFGNAGETDIKDEE